MPMRYGTFFLILMAAALVSSLGLRSHTEQTVRSSLNVALWPVFWPINQLRGPRPEVVAPPPTDHATTAPDEVLAENAALRRRLVELEMQLADARAKLAEENIARTTGVRDVAVIGLDIGGRGRLRLAPTRGTIRPGDAVFVDSQIVGRIDAVGFGNQASVLLITDRSARVQVEFVRVESRPGQLPVAMRLDAPPVVAQGNGVITNDILVEAVDKSIVDKAGLRPGDQLVLRQATGPDAWSPASQGKLVAVVTEINAKVGQPGFAEIRAKPTLDLATLKRVSVERPPD